MLSSDVCLFWFYIQINGRLELLNFFSETLNSQGFAYCMVEIKPCIGITIQVTQIQLNLI